MFLLYLVLIGGTLWFIAHYWLKALFFNNRFFWTIGVIAILFLISFFYSQLFEPVKVLFVVFLLLLATDIMFLFAFKGKPQANRIIAERMSNGDKNPVALHVKNTYPFTVKMHVIDELPEQFQARNNFFNGLFRASEERRFNFFLRPVERGEYHFGDIIIYVSSLLGFISRRYNSNVAQAIPVYPSFFQMRKYDLIARDAQIAEAGTKKLRKLGLSLEFEHVKEYTRGDDIRIINWKATARKGGLMVNNYLDERSQQVFCVIDKGRLMKMPFAGLSLLDYAINSALVMCNVSLRRHDRFGLITFAEKIGTILPADKKATQLQNVLQILYNQTTRFLESDFEMLYKQVRANVRHRSLLILFTNFESFGGMQRQLPYLRMIAKYHLLLVVFFENTELKDLASKQAKDIEGVYVKTIAEKFMHEKKMIVKELQNHGILSILTTPENLTVNTVNKYLELKARQAI
ncbi:MAG TPA: DUF58 domain-containing protein [Chitinophagaceae bacterium]|nr:DUF58 domain-containing protein [Chitinophagaceae bacterium]